MRGAAVLSYPGVGRGVVGAGAGTGDGAEVPREPGAGGTGGTAERGGAEPRRVGAGRTPGPAGGVALAWRAVELAPDDWRGHLAIADATFQLRWWRESVVAARTAVGLAPEEAAAHRALAVDANRIVGSGREARREAKRAKELGGRGRCGRLGDVALGGSCRSSRRSRSPSCCRRWATGRTPWRDLIAAGACGVPAALLLLIFTSPAGRSHLVRADRGATGREEEAGEGARRRLTVARSASRGHEVVETSCGHVHVLHSLRGVVQSETAIAYVATHPHRRMLHEALCPNSRRRRRTCRSSRACAPQTSDNSSSEKDEKTGTLRVWLFQEVNNAPKEKVVDAAVDTFEKAHEGADVPGRVHPRRDPRPAHQGRLQRPEERPGRHRVRQHGHRRLREGRRTRRHHRGLRRLERGQGHRPDGQAVRDGGREDLRRPATSSAYAPSTTAPTSSRISVSKSRRPRPS